MIESGISDELVSLVTDRSIESVVEELFLIGNLIN